MAAPTWDAGQDPSLAGRRASNDLRYAVFFRALLVLGGLGVLGGIVRLSALSALGGLMLAAAAISVRHAGRIRRDELSTTFLGAYGHELGWFALGFGLVIGGAYVAHLG